MVQGNLQIARCFEKSSMEASFICAPASCPGHDVTLSWREVKDSGYVDEYERQWVGNLQKDRCYSCESTEWNDKLGDRVIFFLFVACSGGCNSCIEKDSI